MAKKRQKRGNDKRNIWKNNWKPPIISIGIDQSYTRTGIAMAYKGKLKKIEYIDFRGLKKKTEKRRAVAEKLEKYIKVGLKYATPEEIVIVCEKIRTFSSQSSGVEAFAMEAPILSPNYIKATGALIASIVDVAFDYGIQVYSVDTRSWKSVVLGTSKPLCEPLEGVSNPQKIRAIKYIMELGFKKELEIIGPRNSLRGYCDDAADAACIALYPNFPIEKITLSFEE